MKITQTWKLRAILAALALAFVVGQPKIEKLGDRYQVALPVIALACSVTNGQSVDFIVRYVAQWSVVQGSKSLLGTRQINHRPNGNWRGMPSGHTATAVFGASNLVHQCIEKNLLVKGVVILTAVFVGGSRLEAQAHDIWQVLIGAIVGWLGDRLFRRVSPLARIRRLFGHKNGRN